MSTNVPANISQQSLKKFLEKQEITNVIIADDKSSIQLWFGNWFLSIHIDENLDLDFDIVVCDPEDAIPSKDANENYPIVLTKDEISSLVAALETETSEMSIHCGHGKELADLQDKLLNIINPEEEAHV